MMIRLSAAIAAVMVVGAAPASAATCGAVLTMSTTLRADVTDCSGDGLVIGADGITLDLNGHTVDGAGVAGTAGVRLAGRHGLTIEHGVFTEFGNGVLLDDADGNLLVRVAVTHSVARGIQLQNGSDGNRLEFDTSSDNGRSGFGLLASEGNLVAHAKATGNPLSGLQGFTAANNRIVDNTFTGNSAGIGLSDGSDRNVVARNVVSANADVGISIGGSDNVLSENRAAHDANIGIGYGGDRNRIVANVVTDAGGCPEPDCGVGIAGEGGRDNVVAGNRVLGTRREGIRLNEYEADGGVPAIGDVFRGNLVRDAGTDGIAIQPFTDELTGHGTIKDVVIEGNVVIGSGHDGINVQRPGNTVAHNVALRSGALGIEAVPGVIDGGGNIAHLNDDPLQCVWVACR